MARKDKTKGQATNPPATFPTDGLTPTPSAQEQLAAADSQAAEARDDAASREAAALGEDDDEDAAPDAGASSTPPAQDPPAAATPAIAPQAPAPVPETKPAKTPRPPRSRPAKAAPTKDALTTSEPPAAPAAPQAQELIVRIPPVHELPVGYCARHIELRLSPEQALLAKQLAFGMECESEGKRKCTPAAAISALLDEVLAARRDEDRHRTARPAA